MADEDFLQKFLTTTKLSVPRLALTKYAAYTPGLTLDTTRSKAFCLPTDLQGYIRVNLKGREPDGWVSDGEYDVVCQEIESELLALRHNDLDVPVVKEVVRVRDRLNGSFLDRLPDLSVIWNCDRVVSEVQSPTCGRLAFAPDLSAGGGNHRGVGFALIYGCGVRQGRFGGNVFDMAPTIANWLQEESRPEWEGHILNIAGLEEPSR
jgi:predicted AlkP superfamily phosphohydrolase/phosphomutase